MFAPVLMVSLLPVQLQYFVYKSAGTGTSLFEGYLGHGVESILYTIPADAYIEFKCAGFKQGKRYKVRCEGRQADRSQSKQKRTQLGLGRSLFQPGSLDQPNEVS